MLLIAGATSVVEAAGQTAVSPMTARTTVFLVGDAGNAEGPSRLLAQLHSEVSAAARSDPTVVVFLGDNVYPAGVRRPGEGFQRDTAILRNQLDVVAGTGARALFVPGNHDWDDGGDDGLASLERQAAFFRRAASAGAAVRFLPAAGCPGPVPVDLPGLRLVALDTHWFLHDHARGCPDLTEAEVGQAVSRALDEAGDRATLVVGHHPLRTHGPHGGHFPVDRHFFPLREVASWAWVPLPVLGSAYVVVRQQGVTDQDLSGGDNRDMQQVLADAFSRADRPPLLYAAGHEHSLQVIRGEDGGPVLHLVSGAGSKSTPVGRGEDTAFAGEDPGYMRVDVMGERIRIRVQTLTADAAATSGPGAASAESGDSRDVWCGWIDGETRTVQTCPPGP